MKPISDGWINAKLRWGRENATENSYERDFKKALRELARTRAAIRDHKDILKRSDCSNEDRMLYRATLPEGDR